MIGMIAVILVGAVFILNSNSGITGSVVNVGDVKNLRECKIGIEGMYCQTCAYGVKAQIEELDGVISAEIDYKTASGVVLYDSDKVDAETIAAASTAYPASVTVDNPK